MGLLRSVGQALSAFAASEGYLHPKDRQVAILDLVEVIERTAPADFGQAGGSAVKVFSKTPESHLMSCVKGGTVEAVDGVKCTVTGQGMPQSPAQAATVRVNRIGLYVQAPSTVQGLHIPF